MTCVICKRGETQAGSTTVTLERRSMTLIVKAVPAQLCTTCGEAYVDEATTELLLREAEQAARSGVQVEVRTFIAA